jgi:Xaa-Pro aminopeptidase
MRTNMSIIFAHYVLADAESLRKALVPQNSELVSIDENLVDVVWGKERPAQPCNKVFPLDIKYSGMQLQKSLKGILSLLSGESHLDKLRRLREDLVKKKAKAMVVTMLDEVAWLFNLRGSDIDYNPGE